MSTKSDLVLKLGMDTADYEQGLDRARKRMPSFEREMKRGQDRAYGLSNSLRESGLAATQASMGGYNKMGRAMLELSRGAEDAATVYGTMGLQGAIRASSNNLSQFASIIHPAAGAVTGFAMAIGATLIPQLLKLEDASETSGEKLEEWLEKMELASKNKGRDIELADIAKKGSSSIEEELKAIDRRSAMVRAARDEATRLHEELLQKEGEIAYEDPVTGDPWEPRRVLPGSGRMPGSLESLVRDVAQLAPGGSLLVDSTEDVLSGQGSAALDREAQLLDERTKKTQELQKLAEERARLEEAMAKARVREEDERHAKQRDRDREHAKEEERDLKRLEEREKREAAAAQRTEKREEAARKKREQSRRNLDRELRDELHPDSAPGSRIVDSLEDRLKQIDAEFGGDQQMKDRAERSARDQLSRLQSPSGPSFAGSPAALQRGSSAAVGLINRVRNQSVTIAEQQLKEARELNRRIDELVDTARHPADLPPSEFN